MRLILLVLLMFSSVCFSQTDKPTNSHLKAARQFGYRASDIIKLNAEKRRLINKNAEIQKIAKAFDSDPVSAAQTLDVAVENLLRRADGVLRNTGFDSTADDIADEFLIYRNYYQLSALGMKEIGDHPPMSDWLKTVHDRIEKAIGDFWCKFFHFHDIMIINYATPVVFKPSKYLLPDYKDHFAGHHVIWGFYVEHYGLVPVIVYWTVEAICSAATAGMGAATFACSPIASFTEFLTWKHVAPPLAERVWKRAQE